MLTARLTDRAIGPGLLVTSQAVATESVVLVSKREVSAEATASPESRP